MTARILIVEDDNLIILQLRRLLDRWGYDHLVAETAKEAIRTAEAERPDLALMDISLNDAMDGVAVADILRKRLDIPSIYLTAYADDALLERAGQTEPYGYLIKPIQNLELRATLQMALSRRRTDRRLKQSEARLRAILDAATAGVALLDREGVVLDVNSAYPARFGMTRDELIGGCVWDLFPPDAAEKRKAQTETVFRTGRPLRDEDLRDGVWNDYVIYPVRTPDGRIDGVAVHAEDATARKQAEFKLEESVARLQGIFDAIPARINVVDREFNLLDANVGPDLLAKLGYRNKSEIIGRKCYEVFKRRRTPCGDCPLSRCLASGKLETRTSAPEEEALMGYATKLFSAPVRNARGEIIGGVECAMDITDLRKMENELRRTRDAAEAANRAKSEFVMNMSHEIRTPLNAVVGLSHLLADTRLTDEQEEYIDAILASSDMLLSVINDILDFSKIEAGKVELDAINFDLEKTMKGIAGVFFMKAREKRLELTCDIDENVPLMLKGDMGRLRQVLLNLVTNAVKFTEKGSIRIAVSLASETPADAVLRFSVKDTGIGIPEDRLHTLFAPFSQADASVTRKYGGTGLGLAISKKIVEIMGGGIGVDAAEGAGSNFWFTAVLKKQDAAGAPDGEAPKRPEAMKPEARASRRILIAEDNIFNQKVAQTMLNKMGFASDVAENGRAALRMLAEKRYDLVLMDIQMPEMDGVEATKAIRRSEAEFSKIPIIALTAHAMSEHRENWLKAGLDDYLTKPIKPDKLKDALRRHLAARGK